MKPITLTIDDTASALDVSKSTVFRLIRAGKLDARKLGAKLTLITTASIEALVSGLPGVRDAA